MRKKLILSAIAGIFSLLFSAPIFVIEPILRLEKFTLFLAPWRPLFLIVITVSNFVFMYGFKKLGDIYGNNLLKGASLSAIIYGFFNFFVLFFNLHTHGESSLILQIISAVLYGLISIVLGVSLTDFSLLFRPVAPLAGILNIISGFGFASQIYGIIGIILFIPIYALEIAILFKAAEENP